MIPVRQNVVVLVILTLATILVYLTMAESTLNKTTYYVKPDKPLNISQPCPEPCISLSINVSKLNDLLTSNTILKLQPGMHSIGQDIVVWNKTNISFVGDVYSTEDVVHIACSVDMSLSFVNCSNIIVRDIIFEHCGNFVDTSYMDTAIGENYWYKFPIKPRAALIFVHCFSTTLSSLYISETSGLAVFGINMLGVTTIEQVKILYSKSSECDSLTFTTDQGGGIFLLFQNIPKNVSKDGRHILTIQNSIFQSICSPTVLFPVTSDDILTFTELKDLTGSGIATLFGHNSYLINILIENCTFKENMGNYHSGLSFVYYVGVSGANVSIFNCSFINNFNQNPSTSLHGTVAITYANPTVGSLYIKPGALFQQLPKDLYKQSEISISNCMLTNNTSHGGSSGISFLSTGDDYPIKVTIENVLFTQNRAVVSSALIFFQLDSLVFPNIFHVTVLDCKFIDNDLTIFDDTYANDQVNMYKYASVVALHNTKQLELRGSILFAKNKGSCLFLYGSTTLFNGILTFVENFATVGAGIGLYANSYVLVHEGTNVTFINNTARRRGGAVYVEEIYGIPSILARLCFFQYVSPRGNLDNDFNSINIHIHFANNSADEAGNSVFSSVLRVCSWVPNTAFRTSLPTDVNERLVSFANTTRQQLSSDAYKVCFCSSTNFNQNITDACTGNSYDQTIYPGETIEIIVIGVGQDYGPVPTILYTSVMNSSAVFCSIGGSREVVHELPNNCSTIQYTIMSNSSGICALDLRTGTQPVFPTSPRIAYVNILDCPFGFILNANGVCDCHPLLTSPDNPAMVTNCNLTSQTFTRPGNSWLHTVNNNGTLTEIIARSYCPFGYCNDKDSDLSLTDLDSQCLYKRSGTLCGQCKSGYSSVFGSTQCKKCSNAWLSLLMVFAITGIVLVMILFVLNLTITSGTINGIIFYANVISINGTILFPTNNTFRPLFVFISFLNLDLGIETCFYDGMDEYAKIWLEYVFPVYLIIIVAVIIVMARYTTWAQRAVQSNGVPVLSTLLFLSYTKLLRNASVSLFYNVGLTHLPSGRIEQVWALDANVAYFGFKFTILFIVSLIVFLIIVLPFTIVMLFTKTFLRFRHVAYFKPMFDAYQSPFANPFRFWFGYRLLIRAFLFSTSALSTQNVLLINSITLSGLAIMQGYFQPFNNFYINLWDLSCLLNLTTLFIVSQYFEEANIITVSILVGVFFVQFLLLICFHVFKVLKKSRREDMRIVKWLNKFKVRFHNSEIYRHIVGKQQVVATVNYTGLYANLREPLVLQDEAI